MLQMEAKLNIKRKSFGNEINTFDSKTVTEALIAAESNYRIKVASVVDV
jgi:hypothetical protein